MSVTSSPADDVPGPPEPASHVAARAHSTTTGRPAATGRVTARARTIGSHRPALPPRRALLGALLMGVAAIVAFSAVERAAEPPRLPIVVAARSVDAGARLGAEDLAVALVDVPAAMAARAFSRPEEVTGLVALVPLGPDEAVTRTAVAPGDGPSGQPEYSLSLDRERALDGRVQRGDEVDVLATVGTGAEATTAVVARRARVVGVTTSTKAGIAGASRVTVSIAVADGTEVMAAAHASEVGKVTLVRTTGTGGGALPDSYRLPSGPTGTVHR